MRPSNRPPRPRYRCPKGATDRAQDEPIQGIWCAQLKSRRGAKPSTARMTGTNPGRAHKKRRDRPSRLKATTGRLVSRRSLPQQRQANDRQAALAVRNRRRSPSPARVVKNRAIVVGSGTGFVRR